MKCSKCGCTVFHENEADKVKCDNSYKAMNEANLAIISDLQNEIEDLRERLKGLTNDK